MSETAHRDDRQLAINERRCTCGACCDYYCGCDHEVDWRTEEHKNAEHDATVLASFILGAKDKIVVRKDPGHHPDCCCTGCRLDSVMKIARKVLYPSNNAEVSDE